MKRFIPFLAVVPVMFLLACSLTSSLARTLIKPTPLEYPAAETVPATPPERNVTDTQTVQPPKPLLYYYFVAIEDKPFPAGSIVILPDILILGPAPSDATRSPDTATNIDSALQAMIADPRNAWTSDNLGITSSTFREGTADVVLHGKIYGLGDVVLIAARMQILMTVFAEPSVQTATITLNGKSIANLGISRGSEAKPADYPYTRAEIETFMANNAYKEP